jgi:hypothetical protein
MFLHIVILVITEITLKGYQLFMKARNIFKSLFVTAVMVSFGYSQNLLNIGIGPTWPKGLRDLNKKEA